MDAMELRRKFLDFFSARGHTVVPSSSLIPDDPSVLLTTAGMQQFKPYYTGEADPFKTMHPNIGRPLGVKNAASIQKSFRTSDIDEVGDERHLTFFEMMGNFSFGGYFKEEAIRYAHEFLTKELGLAISYVTVFEGKTDIRVPKDEESRKIWQACGVTDIREQGMDDVFWGPTGSEGPCGPTTEIYCKNGTGQDIEVWNIVFNQFFFRGSRDELLSGQSGKKLESLPTPGVDTGMGLERLAMIAQRTGTIFETNLFDFIFPLLPSHVPTRIRRVVSDHLRGSIFLLADGVRPSNKEAGYVLRRLLRRIFNYGRTNGISPVVFRSIMDEIIECYEPFYAELSKEQFAIMEEFEQEREKFAKSLERGVRQVHKFSDINAPTAFNLYQSFGITFEVIRDIAPEKTKNLTRRDFEEELKKHQEVSRAGSQAKFGGHGLYLKTGEVTIRDESEVEQVTRLHTATHLLHAALRAVLGPEVRQDGSDITVERTRFDFTFPRKLEPEELKKVEQWVNNAIQKDLTVKFEEMSYNEAVKSGALAFFKQKYPPRVKVYTVYDEHTEEPYSKEFCGGPHVAHTGNIGRFIIRKEESSAAGVRRIRAVVE